MDKDKKLRVVPGFSERDLGDEVVILHESGEVMHSFSDSGIFLWKKIKESLSFKEVLQAMLDEYNVDVKTAQSDLEDFLTLLIQQNVLEVV